MRYLLLSAVAVCAMLLVTAGCTDQTEPLAPMGADFEVLALQAPDEVLLSDNESDTHEFREFSTIKPINEPSDIDIRLVRYGETQVVRLPSVYGICTPVTITIVDKIGSRNRWERSNDPAHSGEICSYVEPGSGNLYHVYYEFTLFDRVYEEEEESLVEKGRFLARETARCNTFPCQTRDDVEVLYDLGLTGVFGEGGLVDALLKTFRCELVEDGDRYRLANLSALGGQFTWTEGGEPGEPTAPVAPSGLTATAVSASRIDLAWTDNSDNEDGFRIKRCIGSECSEFVVGQGVNTYHDVGLTPETTYGYWVAAYNAVGLSDWSDSAEATTFAEGTLPAPVANFTYACGNTATCTFTDASTGEITGWNWTFGEIGTFVGQAPPPVTFPEGSHVVVLAVEPGGNTATATISCTLRGQIRCR